MICFTVVCINAENQITQTLSSAQLSEHQAEHLIPTGKMANFIVAFILGHKSIKYTLLNKFNELSENIFALIHSLKICC
jgi:hypothetical protein